MPQHFPVIDLDETLITQDRYTSELNYTRHLEDMRIKLGGRSIQYQAINLSPMGKIFEAFLAKKLPIVLMTKSKYSREDILPILEVMYALGAGALAGCVYINRINKYGDTKMSKGDIIFQAVADGTLPADLLPVLIDNNDEQIASAQAKGYGTIKVLAVPPKGVEVDNSYIWDIIEVFGLKVRLGMADLMLPNKKFRLGM